MTYISKAYQASVGDAEHARLLATHYPMGYHPETHDRLLIPARDRYSGMYVLGVQGMGKSGLLENLIAHDIRLVQGRRNNPGVSDATKRLFSIHRNSWVISTSLY